MAVQADDAVTGNPELRRLEERMREHELQLGRKTLEVEILKEVLTEKNRRCSLTLPLKRRCPLGVSRSNLANAWGKARSRVGAIRMRRTRRSSRSCADLVDARPAYHYRRLTTLLNRDLAAEVCAPTTSALSTDEAPKACP